MERRLREFTSYRLGNSEVIYLGRWDRRGHVCVRPVGPDDKPVDGPPVVVHRDRLGAKVRTWQQVPA